MVKSLVEFFFYYKIACQNAGNGISDLLDFEIFLGGGAWPQTPLENRAYGTRFSSHLLLYLSRLLQNLLRTLLVALADLNSVPNRKTWWTLSQFLHSLNMKLTLS